MKKLFTYFILFIIYPVISFAQANNICLSCHVSDENETITNGFPIVYNHLEPNAPLAGGNFYWVKFEGDEKGHNIIGITEPDSKLNIAPGGDMAVQLSCAGTYGCHGGRTSEFDIGKEDGIVDDTEAIYGAHHEDDSCLKAATLDVDEQGTTVGKSYRFLFGIKGIEDFDWEQDNTNTSHNEYMGAGEYDQTETISSLCAQCHPSYYGTGLMPGGDGIGVGTSSPWLRHPTDIFLPQKGEYAGYGGDGNPYSLIAPVGRCNLYEIIDPAQVKPGKDVVMCLSCHRTHASPYDKMMRWDHKNNPNANGGCSICHTLKGDNTYGLSAHGNTIYGVSRIGLSDIGYAKGNCSHCHEMHASIDGAEPEPVNGEPSIYLLFDDNYEYPSQNKNFCYDCHGPVSFQEGGVTNYNYSKTFGGADILEPDTIYDAFNTSGSSHNLADILDFIKSKWPSTFNEHSNPCSGCHNPHLAQRIGIDPPTSAVTRPTDHNSIWGDSEDELMNAYTSRYQAPYWYNSTNYEPDGSEIGDGSNLVDYVTFCSDCHNKSNIIYSTSLERELLPINWNVEKHGKGNADGGIDIKEPYSSNSLGYVLSCTDCHEPHGSSNKFLIRKAVNGGKVSGTILSTTEWKYLCARCHNSDNEYIHHHSKDAPYPKKQCCLCHGKGQKGSKGGYKKCGKPPIDCSNCHFHGSDDSWAPLGTGRRTF